MCRDLLVCLSGSRITRRVRDEVFGRDMPWDKKQLIRFRCDVQPMRKH